jgi:hypothetical protein
MTWFSVIVAIGVTAGLIQDYCRHGWRNDR